MIMPPTEFKFLSLMAIGDAYGMRYEFVDHDTDKTKSDLYFGPHPTFTEYKPAHYTDDTQMSLANAILLLRAKREGRELTEDDFLNAWLAAFRRNPRHGYSKYMYKILGESRSAADLRSKIDATKGTTSGGAMRAAPFGLLDDIAEIKRLTEMQAKLTHDTEAGVTAALIVALSTYYLRNGGAQGALVPWLSLQLGKGFEKRGYTDNPNNGMKIVRQALNAMLTAKTLSDVLLNAVNNDKHSDTDTVAALAMVMASQCSAIKNDLPPMMVRSLEGGKFGRDYLAKIDKALAATFPAPRRPRLGAGVRPRTQPRR